MVSNQILSITSSLCTIRYSSRSTQKSIVFPNYTLHTTRHHILPIYDIVIRKKVEGRR
ncbi:hypothetical protein DBT_1870 [Dissulfuribacter thermophilus]|uniref:Uncharacterized protein n=1 Tax=Dissulfuribacter thermophilus TaxID=1156395 RepID=A0A1B9F4F4_9BACT|nr:hypothetical protein DBT_1870 [Dissulfuribacter thermophilus]